jgi:predicted aldo/keto reductase-like oxidoreductase
MRRREFIRLGILASAGVNTIGCGGFKSVMVPSKKVQLWKELSHFSPRPSGTMPMNEIGKTGIRVSQLGFGSHIRKEMVGYNLQREYVIREAYDLGINLFDVYDGELECYQYEPMGRFLNPIIDDVVISISMKTYEGRTMEQEFERALRLFGRDYIDLVRCHAVSPDHARWKEHWIYAEKLLRYKEQGKIRAVGVPIHSMEDLGIVLDTYPIDYVIFPYNFYHNICWLGSTGDSFDNLPGRLRRKGVGVITMKPFMGDYLVKPFTDIARRLTKAPEITYTQAALRYVVNSGIEADSTLAGMYSINHLYCDIVAFFEPEMSDEEYELLDKLKKVANQRAAAWLPENYKWLENWAVNPPRECDVSRGLFSVQST